MNTAANLRLSIDALNAMERCAFREALGGIFEHSPHFAERVWEARPFATQAELEDAFQREVGRAPVEEKLALVRAHPDLGERVLRLSAFSASEQQSAGLDSLTPEEAGEFHRLNSAYRERFGFPFLICVRLSSKSGILRALRLRLDRSAEEELATALAEIAKIARFRLDALITD